MSLDGPMFNKPPAAMPNNDADFEHISVFEKPTMSFGDGIKEMVSLVRDSRRDNVGFAALCAGMVLSRRGDAMDEVDHYAHVQSA